MLRAGPGDLVIEYYRVRHTSLRKLADEEVRMSENHVGKTRIEEVFGAGYSELPHTTISYAEVMERFPELEPARVGGVER